MARSSSNTAPTASAPTRCSTPSSTAQKVEVEEWKTRGPIHTFTARLKAEGKLTEEEFLALDAAANAEVEAAVAFAEAGTWEPVEDLLEGRAYAAGGSAMTRKLSYREAMREAMHEALTNDPRVFLMGEDVGRYGGTYAFSKGFLDEFGPERIRDTPLSELGFVGAGIGAALGGLRPIVEVMTVNFSLLALDQIVNSAALLRHMSGGQFSVPLVIRMTHRRRPPARRPALAQPRRLVRAHPRHQGAGAGDHRGRARHARARRWPIPTRW